MAIFSLKKYIIYAFAACFLISATSFSFAGNTQLNDNSILLFVSLGMPDNTLKAYLFQANEYHIPVVIRGLYTDSNDLSADKTVGSFNDTANRIFNLLKSQQNAGSMNKKMGGISINPLLFRSFNIAVVPALVVTSNAACIAVNHQQNSNENCSQSDFDVVFGNIPIQKQLSIIAEKSDSKTRVNIVESRLKQYESSKQNRFK